MTNSQNSRPLAIFLPTLEGGGAERVAITLANAFAAKGLAVDMVVGNAVGPYRRDIAADVRVIDLQSSRISLSLPALIRYLRRERPSAMMSVLSEANVIASCARLLSGVDTRLMLTEHNSLSRVLAGGGLKSLILKLAMRVTYPTSHSVVGVSQGVSDDVEHVLGLKPGAVTTIYNPIVESPAAAPPKRSTTNDIPLIVAAGRLTEQKDYPTLLRALARLRQSRPVQLVILGEGELRAPLEQLRDDLGLADIVTLPGFSSDLAGWFTRADLFVLSSAWEGFGNVLVEAMACGTPVVSTDCPSGPSEILGGGQWGRLVPVGDDTALAAAMAATLDDATHPDVVSRAADFSVARAVDAYLDLLDPKD